MAILERAEVDLPLVTPLSHGVTDVEPNAGSKRLENVMGLKGGEVARRVGFTVDSAQISYPPGDDPSSFTELLDDNVALSKNKVYYSGSSLSHLPNFIKSRVDKIGTLRFANMLPYSMDSLEDGAVQYTAMAAQRDEVLGASDLIIVRTILQSGVSDTLSANEFTPVTRTDLIDTRLNLFPICVFPNGPSSCKVFFVESGDVRYVIANFATKTISTPVTFKSGANNRFIHKVYYSGSWHLVILEQNPSNYSLIVTPHSSYSPISNASTGAITSTSFNAGHISDVLVKEDSPQCISFLVTFQQSSMGTWRHRRFCVTKVIGGATNVVELPAITCPQINVFGADIGASHQFPLGFMPFQIGHLVYDQNGLTIVEFDRIRPYVTYHRLDPFGSSIVQTLTKYNGAFTTPGGGKFLLPSDKLSLSLCHLNECYLNESENLEEFYRTSYLASFDKVDETNDAILLEKVDEFDSVFIRHNQRHLLTGSAGVFQAHFVTVSANRYGDDKGISEFSLNVYRMQIGEGLQSKARLISGKLSYFTCGGLPFSVTERGIGRPFTVFPALKPRVMATSLNQAYWSVPASNTARPLSKWNQGVNNNKYRFYHFPPAHALGLLPISITVSIYNGSSWVNHTVVLYNDTPPGGSGIKVKLHPLDDPLTVGFRVFSAIADSGATINGSIIPLGDGEFLHGRSTAPDNSSVYSTPLLGQSTAGYLTSSPATLQWATQKEVVNFGRSTFCQESKIVTKTIRSNSHFAIQFCDVGFNNLSLSNQRYYFFQTKMNGSQFYMVTTASESIVASQNTTVARLRYDFNATTDLWSTLRMSLSPFVTTDNSKLDLNEVAPWTGGVIQDGPMPSSVSDFFTFKNRMGVVTKDGRIRFSKALTNTSTLPTFPLELELESQAFNESIMTAVGLADKLLVVTKGTIYAVFGDTFNDTLTQGGFSEPRRLTDIGADADLSHLKFSDDQLAFIFSKNTIHLITPDLQVVEIGRTIVDAQVDFKKLLIPLVFRTNLINFILWPSADGANNHLVYDRVLNTFVTWTNQAQIKDHCFTKLLKVPYTKCFLDASSFTDGTPHFTHTIDTGWLSANRFQSFYRIFKALFIGRYFTPHTVTVTCYYNYDMTLSSTHTFNSSDIMSASGVYQFLVHPSIQKIESIRFVVTITPTTVNGPHQTATLSRLTGFIGVKEGAWKVQSTKRG